MRPLRRDLPHDGFPVTLVVLAGFIALLLWGTHMVQTGMERALGPRLRSVLDRALRTRLRAFSAGLGVAAILQSSTATGLMVTGFAAGGIVDLVPPLAVMLGANVGTTLIVQVLSFDIAAVAPALMLLGVVLFRRNRLLHARDVCRVFIGRGPMLIALHQLVQLVMALVFLPALGPYAALLKRWSSRSAPRRTRRCDRANVLDAMLQRAQDAFDQPIGEHGFHAWAHKPELGRVCAW